jgi:outer membrane protein OmpA-like peptidoglycan-associated protein
VLVALLPLALAAGCLATKPYVHTEVRKSDERTQQQLQVVDRRLGVVEHDLAEERTRHARLEADVHDVRALAEKTAQQGDQTRERVAKVEGAARDALQAASRVPPPKTPEPDPGTPETLVVFFGVADWVLDRPALLTLEKALRRLRDNPALVVKVEGHADSIGSSTENLKLSQRRANEVWHFLVANGVKRNRIEAQAKGEAEPIASNQTPTGRDYNRRVAVTLSPGRNGAGSSLRGIGGLETRRPARN